MFIPYLLVERRAAYLPAHHHIIMYIIQLYHNIITIEWVLQCDDVTTCVCVTCLYMCTHFIMFATLLHSFIHSFHTLYVRVRVQYLLHHVCCVSCHVSLKSWDEQWTNNYRLHRVGDDSCGTVMVGGMHLLWNVDVEVLPTKTEGRVTLRTPTSLYRR